MINKGKALKLYLVTNYINRNQWRSVGKVTYSISVLYIIHMCALAYSHAHTEGYRHSQYKKNDDTNLSLFDDYI